MLATSATLPMELLQAASSLARVARKRANGVRLRQQDVVIRLISVDGAPVKTHTGVVLAADCAIADAPLADIVYLPALWRNPAPIVNRLPEIAPWLIEHYENGRVLAGVGTGCWFLAEAGLLDNKPATTHWYYFDEFQKRFPQVQLKRNHFITQAGNLYCTGSVNSLADLTVYFIQRYFNRHIASHVERHFFHEIRSSFENSRTFIETNVGTNNAHPDEDIVQTQIWLQDNYAREIKLQDLAEEFGMSTRTFNRRFKKATGTTPLLYLQNIRMNNAKDLLKTTNLSLSEIIFRVGYQDTAHFSELFKKKHGTTPSLYRTTVRAKLFTP